MNGEFTQARKSRKRRVQDKYIDFGLTMWYKINKLTILKKLKS